ncbi:hypothetical protein ACFW1A_16645 [Kitasatospora sp. NPDC058965]|uniref:hypothetical protein n=1 Tax=Kitasatospora sp. NPDC058965 TaxID=3346682 RepID=UPI003699E3D8
MSDPLEFERRMNPWLFDSAGNLTDQAKQQFPDLAAAAAHAPAPGWSPATGGTVVSVDPAALQQAGQNAQALQAALRAECGGPEASLGQAVSSLNGWASSAAISAAWQTWSLQAQALSSTLDQLITKLETTARTYAQGEDHNQRRFQAS